MRGSLLTCPIDPATRAALPKGHQWLQFGNELLLVGDGTELEGALNARGVAARRLPGPAKQSNLYLVVQKGRLFQQSFPDANVLLDKGRYLVVAMSIAAARRVVSRGRTCFSIEPLPSNRVVYEVRAAPPARRAREPHIVDLLNGLSQPDFQEGIDVSHRAADPVFDEFALHDGGKLGKDAA